MGVALLWQPVAPVTEAHDANVGGAAFAHPKPKPHPPSPHNRAFCARIPSLPCAAAISTTWIPDIFCPRGSSYAEWWTDALRVGALCFVIILSIFSLSLSLSSSLFLFVCLSTDHSLPRFPNLCPDVSKGRNKKNHGSFGFGDSSCKICLPIESVYEETLHCLQRTPAVPRDVQTLSRIYL